MSSHDDLVMQLIEMTGCDIDMAKDVLRNCNDDLSKAIEILCGSAVQSPVKKHSPRKQKVQTQLDFEEIPEKKPEKLILSDNTRFQQARLEAQEKKRWLVVLLTAKPLLRTKLGDDNLRDFTNTRFVPLEIDKEQPDGRWFYSTYDVNSLPVYAVIDPDTQECLDRIEEELNSSDQIAAFLRNFLNEHPEKGKALADELSGFYQTSSDASDSSSSDDSDIIENEEEVDVGELVNVMIRLPSGKQTTIEIGEKETVRLIFQKVASLLNLKADDFRLFIPFPRKELDDRTKTVSELKLKNSTIIVEDKD